MNTIKRLYIHICLALLGIGIVFLGAWDMQRVTAAPVPEAWSHGTNMLIPNAFYGSAQCPDDSDSFYVVAGWQAWFVNRDDVLRFDTEGWHSLAEYPEAMGMPSVTCYHGYLYGAGGNLGNDTSNHFYRYEIASDAWTQLPDLPRKQNGAALVAWDGYLYMIGGDDAPGVPISPTTQVDRYNLHTGLWEMNWGTPMPAEIIGDWLQMGRYIFFVGGYTAAFPINSDATFRYDLVTDSWEIGPSFDSRRTMMTLVITNQYLYAIGGDTNGGGSADETNLVESLDLSAWPSSNWVNIGDPLPAARMASYGFCRIVGTSGEIWSVGGLDSMDEPTVETYYHPSEPCFDFFFGDLPREEWELGNQPDEWAHYVIPVVNNGTITDSYDIEVNSSWVTMAPLSIGPIGAGMTDLLKVIIEVPEDALPGDFDIATLTITSQGDPEASDTATLTTSVTDWQEAADTPIDVAFHERAQCANDPNGFYILGGSTPELGAINDVYYYSAVDDTWTLITHMPRGGGWGHIATCYDSKLYVLGSGFSHFMDVYDIPTGTWTYGLTVAPRDPYGAGMGVWDGELFMVGGTDEVDIYDIAKNAWSDGPTMPVEPFGFGYIQAGQYLYVVGGFSGDWIGWNDNLAITLRLNMADKVWETGPTFTSRRGIVDLGVSESHLYAIAGDVNGGERLDPTGLVEVLDLSQWPDGTWEDINQPLPWALEANVGGFCTEARSGGEVWSVGGSSGTWAKLITIDDTYYLSTGEPCVQNIINLSDTPMVGEGEIGHPITYTVSITNTGNITDYYELELNSIWPAELVSGEPGPVTPGATIQVIIEVQVPLAVHVGDQGSTMIIVYSLRDPNIMDGIQITTTVVGNDIHLEPDALDQAGMYGETITYTLLLANQGTITDTVSFTHTATAWDVILPVTDLELGIGESAEVVVNVAIPLDAGLGELDDFDLIATSAGNPLITDSATLTTTAFWYRVFLPLGLRE